MTLIIKHNVLVLAVWIRTNDGEILNVNVSSLIAHVIRVGLLCTVLAFSTSNTANATGESIPINDPFVTDGSIVNALNISSFLITPDGTRVVYNAGGDTAFVPELFSVRIDGTGFVKLSSPDMSAGQGVFDFQITPDGTRVVYTADANILDKPEIFSVPVAGGPVSTINDPLLIDQGIFGDFVISPDSSTVVYHGDQETSGVFEVFAAPITGGGSTKLNDPIVSGGEVVYDTIRISPDGTRVVYAADQDTDNTLELYSVPIGGGTVTKLNTPLVAGRDVSQFDIMISPDSSYVVYRSDAVTDQIFEIFSVPITGGTSTNLMKPGFAGVGHTIFGIPAINPAFTQITPDSSRVIYIFDQEVLDKFDLYSVPIGGGTVTKLSFGVPVSRQVFSFAIAPDSSRVVYRGRQDSFVHIELYSVPLTGGASTQLNFEFPTGGDAHLFKIAPNSSRVVYSADVGLSTHHDIYSVLIAGGETITLSQNQSYPGVSDMKISPDSTQVLFIGDPDLNEDTELYRVSINGGFNTPQNEALVTGGEIIEFDFSADRNIAIYAADQITLDEIELFSTISQQILPIPFPYPLPAAHFWALLLALAAFIGAGTLFLRRNRTVT